MRILAVDDDHFIRELLPLVFAEAGIPSIDIAASGSEALEMIREAPKLYEFLLLDIMMPEMDGIELCQRVRRIPGYRDTPILMLTAKTDIASIEQAFAAGANDYVTKPFDVKEIANRVHVAQRLFQSAQATPLLDPHGVTEAAPQVPDFALEDSVRLAHTEHMVLPFSLGNYLSQLERNHLGARVVFAARIDHVGPFFASCTSHEFAIALTEVADALAEVIACPELLMAYDGNGTFLCITSQDSMPSWPEIEKSLTKVLQQSGAVYDDGRPMKITVSVGGPMPPNASRTKRVRKTFDRALDRIDRRQKLKLQEEAAERATQRMLKGLTV
ncbi:MULTISPECIES: response regulator transcription factor [unclassified Sulfitobacter]|uniref:response regulator transcription factor n=1 Tax=unclassified Sulfitobacter TaxID=196795 RepID=UPI0007C221DD|nr:MULTISPECIES: response regulator [unclassified Sulfitobacter]KZY06399.1 hypothetical protein A3721_11920 [Sulfitobacter sp. HI0023]KZY23456.1 hypothetical protein A3728_08615 [Sulfitobacter sp. HI0040]KZZ64758.1 hypothetical protein A3764_04210 [Sulfitobacter sp. HI0129]